MRTNILSFLLLVSIPISCMGLSFCAADKHSEWKTTYCQIIRRTYGSTGGREFVYFVDSNAYYGWTGVGYTGSAIGDVYELRYNSVKPKEYEWISELPFFISGEPQEITSGEINYLSRPKNDKLFYVKFKYVVNGKKYQRVQCLPSVGGIDVKLGDKFRVIYAPNNIQRSVIVPPPAED